MSSSNLPQVQLQPHQSTAKKKQTESQTPHNQDKQQKTKTLTKKHLDKLNDANKKSGGTSGGPQHHSHFKMSQFHQNQHRVQEELDTLSEDGENCAMSLLELIILSHERAQFPAKKGFEPPKQKQHQEQSLLKVNKKGQAEPSSIAKSTKKQDQKDSHQQSQQKSGKGQSTKKPTDIYKFEDFQQKGGAGQIAAPVIQDLEPTPIEEDFRDLANFDQQQLHELTQQLNFEQLHSIFNGQNKAYIEQLLSTNLDNLQDKPEAQEFMYQVMKYLSMMNQNEEQQKQQQQQEQQRALMEEYLQSQFLQQALEGNSGYDLQDLLPNLGIHNPDILKASPYAHLLLRQQLIGQEDAVMESERIFQQTKQHKSMSHIGIAYFIKADIERKNQEFQKQQLQNQQLLLSALLGGGGFNQNDDQQMNIDEIALTAIQSLGLGDIDLNNLDEASLLTIIHLFQQMKDAQQQQNDDNQEIEQNQLTQLQQQLQQNQEGKAQEDSRQQQTKLKDDQSQSSINKNQSSDNKMNSSENQNSRIKNKKQTMYQQQQSFNIQSPDKVMQIDSTSAGGDALYNLNNMTPDQQIQYLTESLQNSATNEKVRQSLKSLSIQKIQNITELQVSEIQNKLQLERDQYQEILSQVQSQRQSLSPDAPNPHILNSMGSSHRLGNSAQRLEAKS